MDDITYDEYRKTDVKYICEKCFERVDPQIVPICPKCFNLTKRDNYTKIFIGLVLEDDQNA